MTRGKKKLRRVQATLLSMAVTAGTVFNGYGGSLIADGKDISDPTVKMQAATPSDAKVPESEIQAGGVKRKARKRARQRVWRGRLQLSPM